MVTRILKSLPAAALLWAAAAHAEPVRQDPVAIDAAWARATAGVENTTAVYFTVRANADRGDRLLGASSPLADLAELHAVETRDAVTAVRPVDSVEVPAGSHVTLAPGHGHVLLTGLAVALNPGDTLPVTLLFADAGQVTVAVPVLPRSALGPSGDR